jgi:cytochrome P450
VRELTGYRDAVAGGHPEHFYDELHKGPVRDPELGVVIAGTYRAARQVLDNRRGHFSNAATLAPLYQPALDVREELADIFHTHAGNSQGLAFLDGAGHRERRRRAKSTSSTVPVDEVTAGLVDQALAHLAHEADRSDGRVDIVRDFIQPFASRSSLQRTIGIPADLAEDLSSLLQGQVELLWGLPEPDRQRELVRDLRHVWEICVEAIERNKADLENGTATHNFITGYLAAGLAPGDQLDIYGYVNAGFISNVHSLSNLVVLGLTEPGRWKWLHADPGRVPEFVQQMLGGHSGVHGWFKLVAATGGVELAGEHVSDGSRILVALNSANQAPDRGPDEPNISFSHGAHTCIGKDFASRLLESAVRGLVENYPDARLTAEPEHWANLAFNGYPTVEAVLR